MASAENIRTLDAVIGANLKAWREEKGLRQDDVAKRIRDEGLDWTRAVISSIEAGRRSLNTHEAVLLAFVMRRSFSDLLVGEEKVRLNSRSGAQLSAIRAAFDGNFGDVLLETLDTPGTRASKALNARPIDQTESKRQRKLLGDKPFLLSVAAEKAAGNEAEQRTARKLGEDPVTLSHAAFSLWGRSLTEERDDRTTAAITPGALPRSIQAIRGRITRQLVTDLANRLKEV
jgi:transcriptional regulator with XRE-family HTH domain